MKDKPLIVRPTKIKDKRLKMGNRPSKTVKGIKWDCEQIEMRAKMSLRPIIRD